jgi:hypothetical protein
MSGIALPTFEPLGDAQREFLAARVARVVALSVPHARLREVLLAAGGLDVVPPHYDRFETWQRERDDSYTEAILARGQVWAGTAARLEQGEGNACHVNVARLHRTRGGAIATGYALAEDGLWREHSWIVEASDSIVETTVAWVLYYGCMLNDGEALRFTRDELGGEGVSGAT